MPNDIIKFNGKVTRDGAITIPVATRRKLGIKEGLTRFRGNAYLTSGMVTICFGTEEPIKSAPEEDYDEGDIRTEM